MSYAVYFIEGTSIQAVRNVNCYKSNLGMSPSCILCLQENGDKLFNFPLLDWNVDVPNAAADGGI